MKAMVSAARAIVTRTICLIWQTAFILILLLRFLLGCSVLLFVSSKTMSYALPLRSINKNVKVSAFTVEVAVGGKHLGRVGRNWVS
jgi:hypothetical protein